MRALLVIACSLLSVSTGPGRAWADDACLVDYAKLERLRGVPKATLERVVQRMIDAAWGKGFRELGDPADFDHCHLLFKRAADRREGVVAALCHTQEEAYALKTYVDRDARNWIVWLDASRRVDNARPYRYEIRPAAIPEGEWADKLAHFTVTDAMLDPGKTGFAPSRPALQFSFAPSPCPRARAILLGRSSLLQLTLPDGRRVCQRLYDEDLLMKDREPDGYCLKP